ncbi:MAG: cobalt-precorrin-5B (C(1))-methyltransferase [Candidatus Methanofishera endochildressiae]|uniref:Cobalt-precorrin-5B (C(1))-methyltransferase n=1 Tax=Candidatus Methanofishera endochildressiae TaxID=2738884 RepID=A0A7Z0MMW8_9GAMM|nr:cobalt-precorrin-5B (C(1))-methyltransferase [Candidatus Methanofishera endochildressiae]
MTVDVRLLSDSVNQVLLKGGDGVGTITMRGLGLDVGGPAINPVPRKNIEANIREVADGLLQNKSLEVIISVPGGQAMAKKTLNDRLGIIDGLQFKFQTRQCIFGGFRASVVQGVEVAANQGQQAVVLTTGGRTEKFTIRELPDLDPDCFVQMGDFLGPALDSAQQVGIKQIIIGGMVGKVNVRLLKFRNYSAWRFNQLTLWITAKSQVHRFIPFMLKLQPRRNCPRQIVIVIDYSILKLYISNISSISFASSMAWQEDTESAQYIIKDAGSSWQFRGRT